jgi:hypothetical protein
MEQRPLLSAPQAQAILQFMSRSQISGAEAPAFMECVIALQMIASLPPAPAPKPPTSDNAG